MALPTELAERNRTLRGIFREMGQVLVCFSGGIDSTLVLHVAHDVLGDRAVALTALSESLPEREADGARAFAAELGVEHLVVRSNELEVEGYRTNPTNRCYFCKSELYGIARREARRLDRGVVVDGCNTDDLGDWRPGREAAAERGVRSPLVEAGLDKEAVRTLARHYGLATWAKPAFACLASRFPYGTEITAERLRQVEDAEAHIASLGFAQFRARYHGDIVRIELPVADLPRALAPGVRERLLAGCRAAGFRFATIDLAGYRSGSLNEGIAATRVHTDALSLHRGNG